MEGEVFFKTIKSRKTIKMYVEFIGEALGETEDEN